MIEVRINKKMHLKQQEKMLSEFLAEKNTDFFLQCL